MVKVMRNETPAISPAIGSTISATIRDRIREMREQAGLGRAELAERAQAHGAPETMTANVIGFLERGRRSLTLEELVAIARALDVTPLELAGNQAAVLVGEGQVEAPVCPSCGGEAGQLEAVVRRDINALGKLGPLEETLAATAIRLAAAIDAARGEEAVRDLPKLARELRAVIGQVLDGRRRAAGDDDEADLDDLDEPE